MSTLAERVVETRAKLGISQAEVGARAGVSQQAVLKVENGQTRRPKWLPELAEALGVSADWLRKGEGSPSPDATDDLLSPQSNVTKSPQPVARFPVADKSSQRVPVRGTAAGAISGAFQLETDIVDYAPRPPGIADAKNVYALYIRGTSMEPCYWDGQRIYVHPDRPARIGDHVIVQCQDGEHLPVVAYCKKLVRRTEEWLHLAQYNPECTIKVKATTVMAVHLVLPWDEVIGF